MAGGGARRTNAVKGTASCKANQAKPCDVATLKISVTDAEKKTVDFSTDRRLTQDQVAAKTPDRARNALRSADFYIEVLGSSGAKGEEAKQAKLTATATYEAGCGRVEHTRPLLIDPAIHGPRPASGAMVLDGPPDGSSHRDAVSTLSGSSSNYTLIASACGRPTSLARKPKGALRATVAVFTPQDWSIKFSAPAGFKIGWEQERGLTTSDKEERETLGLTTRKDESSRDASGNVTQTRGRLSDGIYTERENSIEQGKGGPTASSTLKVSQQGTSVLARDRPSSGSSDGQKLGFFERREISEKTERQGDGPYIRGELEDEKSFDPRGFQLEVLRNDKTVFDTDDVKEDVETVLNAVREFVDVLKGLPKAGYWMEGSVKFLAGDITLNFKRQGGVFKGPRCVCIGNAWKIDADVTLFEGEVEVGAGLKMKALTSFYGGAELYAYLSGKITLGVAVEFNLMGEDEPPPNQPAAPPSQGKLEFEGKIHGKASVIGVGWEYERSAEIKGEMGVASAFVNGGFRMDLTRSMGRWRFRVVEKDMWGVPRSYEIEDLWAVRTKRLSDDRIEELDEAEEKNTRSPSRSTLTFNPGRPFIQYSSS